MSAPNNEALAGDAAQRFEEHTQGNSDAIVASASFCGHPDDDLDHPDDDHIGLDESDDRRGFGRIKAELALRGYGLLETSGGFLILRWGWTKLAPDMSAVGRFLKQVGGNK